MTILSTPHFSPGMNWESFGAAVCSMDAAFEPTGMYLRRVAKNDSRVIFYSGFVDKN